jgi:beta-glucosidase
MCVGQRGETETSPPARPAERVDVLLASMDLEQKVAQLSCGGRAYEMPGIVEPDGRLDEDAFAAAFPHGVGQIGRVNLGRDAEVARDLAIAIDGTLATRTRHGIGALFNEEGVHGLMGRGATVFPAALAIAATWDTALAERVYAAVAAETRARGANYVYAPVLDLARDPRWGRVEETFGEDVHLVSEMGRAAVFGLQGRSPGVQPGAIAPDRVLACAKHFVGHGVPQGGLNGAPVQLGRRELREDHLPPFVAAIDAGVGAIMAAYHDLDGIPVHADPWLLTEVLRDELGFTGMVTSDGFGVPQLASLHRIATDPVDAARQAFTAGIDCEVPEPRGAAGLVDLVRNGELPEAVIDRAARNVLVAKDRLGLLPTARGRAPGDGDPAADQPVAADPPDVDLQAHDDLAMEVARRSVVLLTNPIGLLPLDEASHATIVVTGPNAQHAHLGGYCDPDADGISVLDGICARFRASTVTMEEGCRITDDRAGPATWWAREVTLADPDLDDDRLAGAVAAAAAADVAVVVVGGNEATHREGWWFDHLGDRASLTLAGRQDELVERIAATGTPTVAVVISGGPVDLRRVSEAADAVLWTSYPGQQGGAAIAELLAGDTAPSGRLPVTFPSSSDQLPIYAGQRISAGRGYLHEPAEPLFRFGHGLTYTTFAPTGAEVAPDTLSVADLAAGATFHLDIEVANTGGCDAIEVLRVTVTDPIASTTRPRGRLGRFQPVAVGSGRSERVRLSIGQDELHLLDRLMRWVVEPGVFEFTIHVGDSATTVPVTVTP